MKEQNLKLLFYLKKGAKSKESRSPIMARLTVGRTMSQFSCKVVCSPKLWDSRKNRLLGKSAEAVAINAELDRLQLSVHQTFEALRQKQGAVVTAKAVKHLVLGLNSDSQGLLYHLEEYLARFRERVGIDRSERRYKCLLQFRNHLEAFIKHRNRMGDVSAPKADRTFIEDFEGYFSHELGYKLNTTAGYLTMLASLLKDLHKRHIIDSYPFLGYSIRWDVGSPRYITKEELLRIVALDEKQLGEYELVSRDMFVFSCYTGSSYTDIYHLTAEHLIEEGGMTWIRKPRVKTGNIPLLPEASALIEQYRGIHSRAFRYEPPKGYLLPIPGADTVNIHLKKIAKLCKISKRLTFHMARHRKFYKHQIINRLYCL
ncbi:MAG: phage integrase SAM-like domain-containing protein [Porphyromonadaceae bacterium]|nr:phage integrase SAM-like domain-containing protein [Porphyromonadaceae bacterium]